MAFHVGQRVVCVDDRFSGDNGSVRPVKGTVYTIRSVLPSPVQDGVSVLLREIQNPVRQFADVSRPIEQTWNARRFRPLCESRLDQFRAHLAPAPKTRVAA